MVTEGPPGLGTALGTEGVNCLRKNTKLLEHSNFILKQGLWDV